METSSPNQFENSDTAGMRFSLSTLLTAKKIACAGAQFARDSKSRGVTPAITSTTNTSASAISMATSLVWRLPRLACPGLLLVHERDPAGIHDLECLLAHVAVALTRSRVTPGLLVHDGNTPADNAIKQRTFADVRTPDDSQTGIHSETRARILVGTSPNTRADVIFCARDARETVFELLMTVVAESRNADELLEERSPNDRALVQELFYGCLRQKTRPGILLRKLPVSSASGGRDYVAHRSLPTRFMRVPAYAAVHEAVELAKKHAAPAEAKFVNAVLRRADPSALKKADAWVRCHIRAGFGSATATRVRMEQHPAADLCARRQTVAGVSNPRRFIHCATGWRRAKVLRESRPLLRPGSFDVDCRGRTRSTTQ